MSGSAEFGKCECCGKENILMRRYYYYRNKCDCCVGDKHIHMVRYCNSCIPKPPDRIRIVLENMKPDEQMDFEKELEMLINKYSKENESDTPDFILAQYLQGCLTNYTETVKARDRWYDHKGRLTGQL
jgi:hypothetical protein